MHAQVTPKWQNHGVCLNGLKAFEGVRTSKWNIISSVQTSYRQYRRLIVSTHVISSVNSPFQFPSSLFQVVSSCFKLFQVVSSCFKSFKLVDGLRIEKEPLH